MTVIAIVLVALGFCFLILMNGMLDALNENCESHPEVILNGVKNAVDGFVKEAEQFDDLTMMCIEYKGNCDTEE